jgi:hypothetical protein
MNKRALTLAFVLMFLFSALAVLQSVSLVKANPMPFPPTPNTDPPIVTVQSPNNITYYVNVISLNFTVTMPDSWGGPDSNGNWYSNQNRIKEVNYLLDGQKVALDQFVTPYSPPTTPKVQNFSINLEVNRGAHTLQINVLAESPFNPILPPGQGFPGKNYGFPEFYHVNATQTIDFTVDAGPYTSASPSPTLSPSPSPSPSLSPSPSQEPTPLPETQQSEPDPFPTTLVAASATSVATIAVGAGLLLLYRKRRREAAQA